MESLLKSCGHILYEGWSTVLDLLLSVAEPSDSFENNTDQNTSNSRANNNNAPNNSEMIPLGFRTLQVVLDESLDRIMLMKNNEMSTSADEVRSSFFNW